MRPDAFAAVMATGIVSIAAADHGVALVSVPLAVVAVVLLPVLMYGAAVAWKRDSWSLRELDTSVGLLTYVAACAVLAGRFATVEWAVLVFGALALTGWVSLLPLVIRDMWRERWTGLRNRARGAWMLASVATSGLAIVSVASGIVFWGLVFWVLALALYCVMAALVGWRALHDPAVRRDVPADHWILMGGTAIATLAGEHVHAALPSGPIADLVRVVTVVTWVLATVQLVPLACVGWHRVRDWPAVFPLGMYSAATYAVAGETHWPGLTTVSLVFLWIACALWLLTLPRLPLPRFRRALSR
jgi:Voltage-dependent anion channel